MDAVAPQQPPALPEPGNVGLPWSRMQELSASPLQEHPVGDARGGHRPAALSNLVEVQRRVQEKYGVLMPLDVRIIGEE